jgi:hypothetical protein
VLLDSRSKAADRIYGEYVAAGTSPLYNSLPVEREASSIFVHFDRIRFAASSMLRETSIEVGLMSTARQQSTLAAAATELLRRMVVRILRLETRIVESFVDRGNRSASEPRIAIAITTHMTAKI